MKLKNIFLTLSLLIGTMTVFGQTTSPDATKPYIIFDSTYNLESTSSSSNTTFDIYYDNTSGNDVKGIQFSFNYDNTVFDEPTLTYNNTSGPAGYLSYDVDSTSGVIKVVWVYSGSSTTFDMIAGNMFTVNAPFLSNYTNSAVADVDFTTDLTAYYVKSDGTDGALGTQDNGGDFIEPAFDYTATILNSGTNPADSIDVILQK